MNLLAHYDAMRTAALPQLAQGQADLDPLLDAGPADTRRGLTLLARPAPPVAAAVLAVAADLQQLEPDQYYYPATDLHLTVLSLISCRPGFTLADVEPAAYFTLAGEVLADTPPFTVELWGLTASPNGILVQGFPQGNALAELRTRLRQAFQTSGLPHTIDQRYRILTAHCTLVRFRVPLRQPAQLAQAIERYRHYPFGTFTMTAIELVFNDWYQRAASTTRLREFTLLPAPGR